MKLRMLPVVLMTCLCIDLEASPLTQYDNNDISSQPEEVQIQTDTSDQLSDINLLLFTAETQGEIDTSDQLKHENQTVEIELDGENLVMELEVYESEKAMKRFARVEGELDRHERSSSEFTLDDINGTSIDQWH